MAIQNEQQYQVTQTNLKELEQALANLDINPSTLSPRLLQAQKQGVEVLIARLRSEIVEYDRFKQQLQTTIATNSEN
ncbi:MAG: hypothetical protein KME17_12530 [Cyanosarcina radialis HA8281-LM2]|nr:hypothetical protein [Cyanosarcina radialis HA8281-LM2]